jgi:hypothetical protein
MIKTTTLRHGVVALAKDTKYGRSAYTFTNRTQAQNAADKANAASVNMLPTNEALTWTVRPIGRPFFVVLTATRSL